MEDNVPLPKINKIPFIVVDAVMVLVALVVLFKVELPLSSLNAFLIIGGILVGCSIACLPFIVEFLTLAKLKKYDLSQANTENARRIESAMLGIQEIGESIVQQSDRSAEIAGAFEILLERMENRIGQIETPAALDPEDFKTALREQLEAVKEDFAQSITEQVAMTSDTQHDKLNAALSKLQGLPMQVSLLGDLAGRYQSLAAMISDTAASLIQSTPEPASKHSEPMPEGSVDGILEADVEENVAAELVSVEPIDDYDEMDRRFEAEMAAEAAAKEAPATEEPEAEEEVAIEEDALAEEEAETDVEAESEEVPEEAAPAPVVDLENFDQLDQRFEEEMAAEAAAKESETTEEALAEDNVSEDLPTEDDLDEPEAEVEVDDDAEVEFLTPEDLAEDEPAAEPAAIAEDVESLDDDDFDIALSEIDEPEEVVEEATEPSAEEVVEEASEVALADDEESGMGFDDWDDFGDIAPSGDVEEAAEEAPAAEVVADETSDEEPEEDELIAQPELMEDIPTISKPTKKKGATTLIAQVLIGIGNKPYVRGTGPGLSEDVGVAMEFLEIGKWQWIAPSSDEPVTVRIYKNDEEAAEGEPMEIPAGQRRSMAPKFPSK